MRLDVFTRVIFVEYNAFGRETAAMLSFVVAGDHRSDPLNRVAHR